MQRLWPISSTPYCTNGPRKVAHPDVKPGDASQVINSDENVVIAHNWAEILRFMWDYVGIVRTDKRLQRALNRVQLFAREIHDFYSNHRITAHLIKLRNLVVVAELIISASLQREKSRRLQLILDNPDLSKQPSDTVLIPGTER